MAIEIVDFPIKNDPIFQFVTLVYQRVNSKYAIHGAYGMDASNTVVAKFESPQLMVNIPLFCHGFQPSQIAGAGIQNHPWYGIRTRSTLDGY